MRKWFAVLVSACVAGLMLLAAAGCGGASKDGSTAGGQSGGGKYHIVVLAWPTSDPFFGALQKGTAEAAKDLGQDVKYAFPTQSNPQIPDWINLLKQVVASKPDALVVADFFPDQADGILASASKSGIPIVLINSGDIEKVGALAFIGTTYVAEGAAGAKKMVEAGVKKALYVQHCAGTAACQDRQKGFVDAMKAAGREATVLNLTSDQSANRQAALQAIRGTLVSDKSIDGAVSSASQYEPLKQAIAQVGREVKTGTFELSNAALQDVAAGKDLFMSDQQQFLQGYYGVQVAVQYLKYDIHPLGHIFTGPRLLDQQDAEKALKINQTDGGVRGGG
ncbi:putative secreted protein [Candidatus Protofrankia californiensis]|uniref:Putative secreted protein n=1 Tax=Candidatus Protofrankia californiensis TaxID=1839754 RepID=A0A1C3NTF9_9ACTN|nr:putative secreted protein [Candidatus Protofrankia californiensis]